MELHMVLGFYLGILLFQWLVFYSVAFAIIYFVIKDFIDRKRVSTMKRFWVGYFYTVIPYLIYLDDGMDGFKGYKSVLPFNLFINLMLYGVIVIFIYEYLRKKKLKANSNEDLNLED